MILIIGGAYQGKRAFAQTAFGLPEEEIYTCQGENIDFSKRCIEKIEHFAQQNPDPVGYFQAHRAQWQDSILIMDDIFCGVVPMGAQTRAWRQECGRLSQYLAGQADRVSRIFCGLEQRLK